MPDLEQNTIATPVSRTQGGNPRVLGHALDLIRQNELTDDLAAPFRTTSGQTKLLRFLARYLLFYGDKVFLFLALSIVMGMMESLFPMTNVLLFDYALPQHDMKMFWVAVVFYMSLWIIFSPGLLTGVPFNISQFLTWYLKGLIRTRIRLHFFRHLNRLSLRFFQRRPVGEHMYRAQIDVDSTINLVTYSFPMLVINLSKVAFMIILSGWAAGWNVTVVIICYLIPFFALYQKVFSWLRRVDRMNRARAQRVDAVLQEGVAAVETVKAFGSQRHELSKFMSRHVAWFRAGVALTWVQEVYYTLFGAFFSPGVLPWIKGTVLTAWAYYLVIYHGVGLGRALMILQYAATVTNPIQQLIGNVQNIRLGLIPAERVMETMSVEPLVSDRPGAVSAPPIQGDVRFERARFAYEDDRAVIKDLSFHVRTGETIGIVGPSGAGKSTLTKLLLRLYDLDSGRILVDGWDIAGVRAESYQKQIGTVMQQTHLFGGTVRDNVALGNPKASNAEITAALDTADLSAFVSELPDGLNTNLAEGTRLSGGERQRLGIARAVVGKPRLLILDEPTASLDSTTEAEVMQTLWKVMRGRTTLIISHRLALVRPLDRILVMDEGRVVEDGRHDDLMLRNGLYAELWREQYGPASAGSD